MPVRTGRGHGQAFRKYGDEFAAGSGGVEVEQRMQAGSGEILTLGWKNFVRL